MNSLAETIWAQGAWFDDAMHILVSHPIGEVLDHLYPLHQVDAYLSLRKKELGQSLHGLLKAKLIHAEDGNRVVMDDDFCEFLFDRPISKRQIFSALRAGSFDIREVLRVLADLSDPQKYRIEGQE